MRSRSRQLDPSVPGGRNSRPPPPRSRRSAGWGLAAALWVALLSPLAHAQTAQEIVAGADAVRNPGRPFRLTSTLTEYVGGQPRSQSVLVVFAKENQDTKQFRNVIEYTQPPRDVGKLVLLDDTRMWFYDPASKASVRISPQQRLVGQASDGDIVTVNLAKDYAAKLEGEETLLDADRANRDCWHLDLAASDDVAIYNRVEMWIEKGTFRPVKGKFYSDSGRLLKIAYYRRYQDELGGQRPTEIILIDGVDSNLVTTLDFADYRAVDIPDDWFQRDFLPRLKLE